MNYGGIKGTIITADANDKINITENGVIITDKAGVIQGVFAADALPPAYQNADIEDFGSRIITTSFCDMHLHAPQYPMLGLGMDLPLMQWLYNYTFRTEAMFKDTGFAREVYSVLARELIARGTTHVCAFSSVHTDASLVLMEELERAGMTFSGTSPDGSLVEIAELSEQDWYVGCQFHPEFKSRPDRPHPLFTGFVAAALRKAGK